MKKIVISIGVLVVIGLVAFFITNRSTELIDIKDEPIENSTPTADPLDITMEFYNAWLKAEQGTSSSPQVAGLLSHPALSDTYRQTLQDNLTLAQFEIDPILCQTSVPPRIGGKLSYVLAQQAEVHILARGLEERSPRIAVVTLSAQAGKWVITNISCSNGETAPEREFSFDREGFLLKNVPPPLNAEYWHLVFEENGIMGHTAPLFFSTTTMCTDTEGRTIVCKPENFIEPSKALVQGDMTEAGVEVKRVTLLP